MPERAFYLWQVRTFTVRLALDFVETLAQNLKGLKEAEEHGGLLLGRIIDNDTVEVTGFEFIQSKHHRGSSYDLGDGERYYFERHVKSFSKRSGPKPVGYVRTHLRPGLFLDQSDFALMSESFSDVPGIALAIRTDQTSPSNAGIFFWEDGDIDRTHTELKFPFDAATLRVQGPVEQEIAAPTITSDAWTWASELKKKSAALWGVAAAIVGFAMVPVFHLGIGPESNAPAEAPFSRPLSAPLRPKSPALLNSPPAGSRDVPKISISEPQTVSSPIFSPSIHDADTASIAADAEPAPSQYVAADAEAAGERSAEDEAEAPATRVQPQSELRSALLGQLTGVISVRDTTRGLVAIVPDSAFDGSQPHAAVSGQLARLAAIVQAHPGLRADVEGNADTSAGEEMSSRRAEAVRRSLIAQGLPEGSVTARGLGDSRLFGPNSTAEGREANRRVEIVISGDPIGDRPLWDHTHALTPER